jgi:Xaa-Pro dipeptidase
MWISRGYSLEYPEEIKQNMCFSVETYVGGPKYKQGVRIEQSIFVTDTGCEIYTTFPLEEEFLE